MIQFKEAARAYFKCSLDEMEVNILTENKEAFVVFKDESYKICTREKFREDIECQLQDKHAALDLDLGC